MNKTQEALKMAIEAFEYLIRIGEPFADGTLLACKEALAELQEQKPVAWMHKHEGEITEFNDFKSCDKCEPLYTTPQPLKRLSKDKVLKLLNVKNDSPNVLVYLGIANAIIDEMERINK